MIDISQTIAPKSDQLNADDLIAGPRVIKITGVSANEGNSEQPVNIYFEGDGGRPYRPCKSMRRVMVSVWGDDANAYVGRSMKIWRDPEVTWGGMKVGGIRILEMSDMRNDRPVTMALTASKTSRKPLVVKPLKLDQPKRDEPEPKRDPEPPAMSDAQIDAAQSEARDAARRGTEAFRGWWRNNPEKRKATSPITEELQKLAAEADEGNGDPFGLPPLDDQAGDGRPSPEELERAEREAREAARMGETE